jgi:hypothetical protein
MSCDECDQLSRAEIDVTRRLAAAEANLQAFLPQEPYGAVAVAELTRFQRAAEELRATAALARSKREEHAKTHLLTMGR